MTKGLCWKNVSIFKHIFLEVNMKKWVSTFIIGFTFSKLESCKVSKVQIGFHETIEKVLKYIYLKWDHFFIWKFKTQVMINKKSKNSIKNSIFNHEFFNKRINQPLIRTCDMIFFLKLQIYKFIFKKFESIYM